MSKPFLIIVVKDGVVGKIWERATWEDAVEKGALVVASFGYEQDQVDDIKEIMLDAEGYYDNGNGDEVIIAQTEDD